MPASTRNSWHLRYQVFGNFAPDSRYGTPDEFARMIDTFNQNGIAVIMDSVVGHYPFQGNADMRALDPIGLHRWKKADGQALYGSEKSPWNTSRYDYANPYVRRFLTNRILDMIRKYGISGIRFDNLDGIRFSPGDGISGRPRQGTPAVPTRNIPVWRNVLRRQSRLTQRGSGWNGHQHAYGLGFL